MQENENKIMPPNIKEKNGNNQKDSKSNFKKARTIIVILFLILFMILSYVFLRGSYLQYKELGDVYVQEFLINCQVKYTIMLITFLLLYIIIYFTNRGIKKSLKEFFENEKKEMPKLLNKSIALIVSSIISAIASSTLTQKIIQNLSNVSFGKAEPIFGLDISYYMFRKPLIDELINYAFWLVVGLTVYITLYHIIVFNRYFDGVDSELLKKSIFMKKIYRNVIS